MKKHPNVIALEEWFETEIGKRCLMGSAESIYLKNRLTDAFYAGIEWKEKQYIERHRYWCTDCEDYFIIIGIEQMMPECPDCKGRNTNLDELIIKP